MNKIEYEENLRICVLVSAVLSTWLIFVTSCTKEAPTAPTDLTAVFINDGFRLSWKKVPHADYYRIQVAYEARDQYYQPLGFYPMPLCEFSGTVYDDRFPYDGRNVYMIEAVNRYGSSPVSEISCYYYRPEGEIVLLYPNPAGNYLYVRANNITRVTVVNFDGEVFADLETNSNSFEVPMGEYESGVYFIHVFSDLGETVKRVYHKQISPNQ